MAYYQNGSAWAAWGRPGVRERSSLPPIHYPISYQRRNLYGGRILQHFQSIYEIPSLTSYLSENVDTWAGLIEKLKDIYGNGRWASYTVGELLVKIALPHVKIDTSEVVDSSGPRQGLELLGFENPTDATLLELQERLARDARSHDEASAVLSIPVEKFESCLCNWSRMCKGDFYLGHNLDRQHDRIRKLESEGEDMTALWEARRAVFGHEGLAELTGWAGVDKRRKKIYAATGSVLAPGEGR
jgi:hypothetical protein